MRIVLIGLVAWASLAIAAAIAPMLRLFAPDPRAYLHRNATPRSIFETRRMGLA